MDYIWKHEFEFIFGYEYRYRYRWLCTEVYISMHMNEFLYTHIFPCFVS